MLNYLRTETFDNNCTLEIYQDDQKPSYSCITCILKRNGVVVEDDSFLYQGGTLTEIGLESIEEVIRVARLEAMFVGP